MTLPRLLRTGEVAEALAVDPDTVRRWVREGKLAAVELPSGVLRFRREDVDRILGSSPAREAGHAVPRLLAAVALAFIVAAGLPAHAGATLLVAVFVGWLFVGLFGAEVSTWGTPAGARHLEQPGRRDRTADR